MKTPLVLCLFVAAFGVSHASEIETIDTQPEPCAVRAWVRAEDLSPDHISRGELRIKVPRAECAHQIESVALRLQLDEFGEFKFLKKGAVLPAANQSAGGGVLYDNQALYDGLSNPDLWTVKAEERRAWMTEATLLENNPDLSKPVVTPFTVAVPAVNYPPVIYWSPQMSGSVGRHAYSDRGYRYIAVVTFTDGRTEHVPAGHTAFIPALEVNTQAPFTWNTTFTHSSCSREEFPELKKRADDTERCLPEAERSTFAAEITLEEGNILRKGRPLKGRVTVRAITDGSTTMSDISVNLRPAQRYHWAQAHAAAGGDTEFYNATSGVCQRSRAGRMLDANDISVSVFAENDDWKMERSAPLSSTSSSSIAPDTVTPVHPYFDFDFELQVPHDIPVDFASYYNSDENLLNFHLTVLYSPEVARCIYPSRLRPTDAEDELSTVDHAAKTEEQLWASYTHVGKAKDIISTWQRTLSLQATVPIIVVGDAPSTRAVAHAHYLTPGVPAPVLRAGAEAEMPASFPVAQPVFTVEALVNTSARLLGTTGPVPWYQRSLNMTWSEDYREGGFAGLLWKKKIVAEERGIWPVPTEVVDRDGQQPFSASL